MKLLSEIAKESKIEDNDPGQLMEQDFNKLISLWGYPQRSYYSLMTAVSTLKKLKQQLGIVDTSWKRRNDKNQTEKPKKNSDNNATDLKWDLQKVKQCLQFDYKKIRWRKFLKDDPKGAVELLTEIAKELNIEGNDPGRLTELNFKTKISLWGYPPRSYNALSSAITLKRLKEKLGIVDTSWKYGKERYDKKLGGNAQDIPQGGILKRPRPQKKPASIRQGRRPVPTIPKAQAKAQTAA